MNPTEERSGQFGRLTQGVCLATSEEHIGSTSQMMPLRFQNYALRTFEAGNEHLALSQFC